MFVRLPGICPTLQLITDASGGGPRSVVRYYDVIPRGVTLEESSPSR